MPSRDHFFNLYHADASTFVKAAPSRVDWRWAKAVELLRLGHSFARYTLEELQDPAITTAYEFRRMSDAGVCHYSDFPVASTAYDIFTSRSRLRLIMEGLLLCDPAYVSYADIAKIIGVDISVVDAYATIFFDARPYRENWGWLYEQFFFNTLHDPTPSHDTLTMARRIGAVWGHEIFVSLYKCGALWDERIQTLYGERLYEIYYKQALIGALCRGRASERDLKTVEVVFNHMRETAQSKIGSHDISESVFAFIQSAGIQVADPSLPENLALPAREPRAFELMRVAHQKAEV
jgi:hypothetical protein